MNRTLRGAALAVPLLIVLTACAGASAAGQTPPSSPTSGSPGGTPTASQSPPTTGTLRGTAVDSFECSTEDDQGVPVTSGPVVPVPASAVVALQLCPLKLPELAARPTLVTRGQPGFSALLGMLSARDGERSTLPCALYADQPQVILARTSDRAYLVHIPVDGCGHYQHPEILAGARQR